MVRTARKHGEVPAKTNEEYFDKNYMNLLILTMTSSIHYTLHFTLLYCWNFAGESESESGLSSLPGLAHSQVGRCHCMQVEELRPCFC